jgi:succinate dehydrogenase / fumarate reductase cytochrome b subunit
MNDRQYFMLKRLHSLSGVIPVAGFVIFHLFENSHSVQGPEAFNQIVHFIRHQPYLYLLEAGLLMPIIFHALLGVWLAKSAKHNVGRFPNRANISYTLQRITGGILLFFIAYHVYTTRFADIPSDQMFQELVKQVSNPLVSAFYALGILAAAVVVDRALHGDPRGLDMLSRFAGLVAALWAGFLGLDWAARHLRDRFHRLGRVAGAAVVPLLRKIAKAGWALLAGMVVLDNLGLDLKALLAGLGVGGLAIALAGQKTIENLFGGLVLVLDQPVRVGDFCRFGDKMGLAANIRGGLLCSESILQFI